ncbi:sulfotransferase 1C4-like [Ischnura elegans]|uniref:sulfotransferase 1C4-like n=1 Tax=Ischnura elegans TaxID=197161 RepID=UPI001ED88C96|nr:sulfotransferase 1C4-like [Ischnura elegans]XP_046390344.1 sulfotransferase 1C4-like [Ischnura elegans]
MSLPFEITDAPDEVNREMWSSFRAEKEKYVQAGPKKYLLCPKYRQQAAGIYNLELRPDDVWVVTFPRSGTTWTQEMVWLINNDCDFEKAKSIQFRKRFPFIDGSIITPDYYLEDIIKMNNMSKEEADALRCILDGEYKNVEKNASPRHIKTHLPFSLLPPKLLDTCKAIYVARNPKDVAVSCYYQNANFLPIGYVGDFEKYFDLFHRDLVLWAPYWSHVEEGWKMRNHPNVLFLFYEDMQKDLPSVIRRVAVFLKKTVNDEQMADLCNHLAIDNFRKNTSIVPNSRLKGVSDDTKPGFIRQGKSGGWKNEFSAELNAKADKWIKEHERYTDLRFQYEI